MIYQMHDPDTNEEMGLITSPLPEEIIQEIFNEYVQFNVENENFSLEDFVEIYRFEKGYDIDLFFIDHMIYFDK